MAKKNFKGIDAFFGENTDKKILKHNEPFQKKERSFEDENQVGTEEKIEKRATFIVEFDQLEKLKAVAYWERKTSKTILKECLDDFFQKKGTKYMSEVISKYRQSNPEHKDA